MQKTKIDWATYSWGPVSGCQTGCDYCYAKSIAHRFGGHWDGEQNTQDDPMMKYSKGVVLEDPMERMDKNDQLVKAPFPYGFFPTFHRYRLDEPMRHKKAERIFVCSMADLFGPWVPDEWILEVFNACKAAPQHRYMFLTKFPGRYRELLNKELLPELSNFFYGTTVNTEEQFNHGFWCYSQDFHTFLSIEPVLGDMHGSNQDLPAIFAHDLMIFGAETGNRKDKVIPKKDWIQPLINECVSMDVSVFMKESLLPIMGEENMLRQMPKGLVI